MFLIVDSDTDTASKEKHDGLEANHTYYTKNGSASQFLAGKTASLASCRFTVCLQWSGLQTEDGGKDSPKTWTINYNMTMILTLSLTWPMMRAYGTWYCMTYGHLQYSILIEYGITWHMRFPDLPIRYCYWFFNKGIFCCYLLWTNVINVIKKVIHYYYYSYSVIVLVMVW